MVEITAIVQDCITVDRVALLFDQPTEVAGFELVSGTP